MNIFSALPEIFDNYGGRQGDSKRFRIMDWAVNGMQTAQRSSSENALWQGKLGFSCFYSCDFIIAELILLFKCCKKKFGRFIRKKSVITLTCMFHR